MEGERKKECKKKIVEIKKEKDWRNEGKRKEKTRGNKKGKG